MGQDELNSLEIIYAMATKKEPVAHYRQKSQSKSDILTGSDKISIKDLLDIVKKRLESVCVKSSLAILSGSVFHVKKFTRMGVLTI